MTDEQLEDLQDILDGRLAVLKEHCQLPPRMQPRYRVGEVVQVNLQMAKIVAGTIRKIFRRPEGVRLLVHCEDDEIAVIHPWQVIRSLLSLLE
jgi:hypothetical protein